MAMQDVLPTVAIKTENGKVIINEADYDAKVHTLWEEKEAKAKPKAKAKKVAAKDDVE